MYKVYTYQLIDSKEKESMHDEIQNSNNYIYRLK